MTVEIRIKEFAGNPIIVSNGYKYYLSGYLTDRTWLIPGWLIELLVNSKYMTRVSFKLPWKQSIERGYLIAEENSKTAILFTHDSYGDSLLFLTRVA